MNPSLVRTPAVSAFVELPPERYRELSSSLICTLHIAES